MGNRIPDELVEQVRQSVDIVDVVSEYVPLKKQGRNYFGLCPFHGESTPSFSVSPEKQIFHCFGCGAGGNAISFIMQLEGLNFQESVHQLAKKTNITLPTDTVDTVKNPQATEQGIMLEAHEFVKKYYHHLLVNTTEGKQALEYLLNRGISREEIKHFELGVALDSWDAVTKVLEKRGYPMPIMEKAGLVVRSERDGNYYDRFRNRLIFPIHNHQGKIVAFSGRIMGEGSPKYLNSPESSIFHKGKLLYQFYQAKNVIRKQNRAILMEGFADVISAFRAGVHDAVATMGTSLTEDQAKVLKTSVDQIIICYDSDQAGINATEKAAKVLQKEGFTIKVAQMPDGLDPDEYIRQFGPEKFNTSIIEASVSLMSFKMQYHRKGKNLLDETVKFQYIKEMLQEIAKLSQLIEQDYYLNQLSKEFSISIEVLKKEFGQYSNQANRISNVTEVKTDIKRDITTKTLLPAHVRAEQLLLAHMLNSSDVAEKVRQQYQGLFYNNDYSEIIIHLYAYYEEGNESNISKFMNYLPSKRLLEVVSKIVNLQIAPELTERELKDYLDALNNYDKQQRIREKEIDLKKAEREGDFVKAATILQQITQLRSSMKYVK
ncbi:DNA primase [Gottfriedia acidiceleris]|uniref:DNA primase n=1 Tax=Bacillaceae TaxID=186817 RepID=UPI000BEC67AA|nr:MULTISPECIES: DNA primase [unclassified Bacillus (in: firmicutes)]PEC51176.1 DNA primase [Bacillus sp. AFS096315]PFM77513.1 DNA primase [Bacillus sp. AFS077874]